MEEGELQCGCPHRSISAVKCNFGCIILKSFRIVCMCSLDQRSNIIYITNINL